MHAGTSRGLGLDAQLAPTCMTREQAAVPRPGTPGLCSRAWHMHCSEAALQAGSLAPVFQRELRLGAARPGVPLALPSHLGTRDQLGVGITVRNRIIPHAPVRVGQMPPSDPGCITILCRAGQATGAAAQDGVSRQLWKHLHGMGFRGDAGCTPHSVLGSVIPLLKAGGLPPSPRGSEEWTWPSGASLGARREPRGGVPSQVPQPCSGPLSACSESLAHLNHGPVHLQGKMDQKMAQKCQLQRPPALAWVPAHRARYGACASSDSSMFSLISKCPQWSM